MKTERRGGRTGLPSLGQLVYSVCSTRDQTYSALTPEQL